MVINIFILVFLKIIGLYNIYYSNDSEGKPVLLQVIQNPEIAATNNKMGKYCKT